jgi:hypothetical protein
VSAARAALALGDFRAAETYARDALRTAASVARGPDTSADVGEADSRLAVADPVAAIYWRKIDTIRPRLTVAGRAVSSGRYDCLRFQERLHAEDAKFSTNAGLLESAEGSE